MKKEYIFTSESVSEGHPDKICDQISDALTDEFISKESEARTAIETLVTTQKIIIAGEVKSANPIDKVRIEEIARNTVKDIGYEQKGFDWKTLDVEILLHEQSSDIAIGVDSTKHKEEGAGDQGIMFGYASNETEVFMPAAIYFSHKILKSLADARHNGEKNLGPDSKAQISLKYINDKPVSVESILVSTQHSENISQNEVREIIRPHVISSLPTGWMCNEKKFFTNPTGRFIIGGPDSDVGLTGRKIIVDTYGGSAPHGGGAFSGKDPTKVDRSAAYALRYFAKNIVAAGLAEKCLLQVSYAIGMSQPISFFINSFGTSIINEDIIKNKLLDIIDLSPKSIRNHLNLNKPIYKATATYGHFGRQPEDNGCFSWEKLDLVEELKTIIN